MARTPPPRPSIRPRRPVSGAALFAVFLSWMLAGCGENGPGPDGSGTFEAAEIRLGAEIPGRLAELRVDEGDRVRAGDTLAVVDRELLLIQKEEGEAGLREAEARALVARRERERADVAREGTRGRFERARNLHERGTATDQAFDDAETADRLAGAAAASAKAAEAAAAKGVDRARILLRAADYRLSRASILSPSDGVVTIRHRRAGELVSPGVPLLTIADLSEMWLKAYIPEPDLPRAKLGAPVDLRVDGLPGKVYSGRVTWIAAEAEFTPTMAQTRDARADLVYALKITVPNPEGELKIGMPGDFFLR
ncbi:MAG: efflux RND transporter periplasmic adaptor subunit [Candidatus Eisenbacteria bacterium]